MSYRDRTSDMTDPEEDATDAPAAAGGTDAPGDGGAGSPEAYETGIYARESSYLGRYVQLGIASDQLINVSFPEEPDPDSESDHPLLDRIVAYLEGERDAFDDVDTALTVPTEHRSVLEAVRGIPYGDQVSVEKLARLAGLDGDDQDDLGTVRMALDTNPLPLVIPDHRVRDGPSSAPPKVEQRLRSLEGL
jgi:methylated-DNA-[protein]-cysteine S-methyltransferase